MPGYSLLGNASPQDQTQPPDQVYFFSEVAAFKIQINMLYPLLYNYITTEKLRSESPLGATCPVFGFPGGICALAQFSWEAFGCVK